MTKQGKHEKQQTPSSPAPTMRPSDHGTSAGYGSSAKGGLLLGRA